VFVHASTGGIYGCRDRPFVEDDPASPMDLYSLTKAQAELAVRYADLPFPRIILRYFFPYGVGTPNPIPAYVRRAVTGEPIQITASRKPRLNPIHIADAVEATVRCLTLTSSVILNIAGVETTTFAEIAELAAAQAGRRPRFDILAGAAEIPYYRADLVANITAMQRTLDFTPSVSLATGIAELALGEIHASSHQPRH
jgi:nucleoside-diphosphate-sugar epimerase